MRIVNDTAHENTASPIWLILGRIVDLSENRSVLPRYDFSVSG